MLLFCFSAIMDYKPPLAVKKIFGEWFFFDKILAKPKFYRKKTALHLEYCAAKPQI
jgi:hypothetical protein